MSDDAPRWHVWKHDCANHGQGLGQPCDPPCEDPWQVDAPEGWAGGTFVTHAEAIASVRP